MSLLDLRTGFWGLAASLLMAASFPHAWGNGSIDLGLGLAWVAPAALAMALGERKPLPTGLCAFAVGWLTHAIIFHWIYIAAVRYGGAPPAVGAIAVGGLALYPALFVGLFGAGWARLRALGAPAALLGGALWAALDHGRSVFLTGFPWALLGYTQHENPWLLPLAAWGGVYGLSFVVATVGLGVALAARAAAGGGARVPAAVVAVVFCLAHGLGAVALWAQGEGEAGPSLRIGVVQGNIDQGQKWDPEAAVRTLTLYEELTREAAARGAVLVLWPETAAPGFPEPVPPGLGSNPLRDRLRRLSEETGVVLVAGALGGEPSAARDSAFVFAPGVPGWQRYDKSHLVPFGEYLPFRRFIGGFVNAIARGSASTDVQAGPGPRALEIPELASVGVPICYELLFPDLVRRFARRVPSCSSRSRTTPGTGAPARPTSSSRSPRCAPPNPACGQRGQPTRESRR